MHQADYPMWFAYFLAQRGSRPDYRRMWHRRNPLAWLLRLWVLLGRLSTEPWRKIERFLRTSIIFPTQHVYVRVPTYRAVDIRDAKHAVRAAFSVLRSMASPTLARFLLTRVHVARCKPPMVEDLTDQRWAARQFSISELY